MEQLSVTTTVQLRIPQTAGSPPKVLDTGPLDAVQNVQSTSASCAVGRFLGLQEWAKPRLIASGPHYPPQKHGVTPGVYYPPGLRYPSQAPENRQSSMHA